VSGLDGEVLIEDGRTGMRSGVIAVGIGLAMALGIGAFGLLLPRLMSRALRTSAPYRVATRAATTSRTAVEALGQPLKFGEAAGTVSGPPPFGLAHLAIPVEGAKASGVIYVTGRLRLRWKFSRMELAVAGSPSIDLRRTTELT
jgi:hypothetical protein